MYLYFVKISTTAINNCLAFSKSILHLGCSNLLGTWLSSEAQLWRSKGSKYLLEVALVLLQGELKQIEVEIPHTLKDFNSNKVSWSWLAKQPKLKPSVAVASANAGSWVIADTGYGLCLASHSWAWLTPLATHFHARLLDFCPFSFLSSHLFLLMHTHFCSFLLVQTFIVQTAKMPRLSWSLIS